MTSPTASFGSGVAVTAGAAVAAGAVVAAGVALAGRGVPVAAWVGPVVPLGAAVAGAARVAVAASDAWVAVNKGSGMAVAVGCARPRQALSATAPAANSKVRERFIVKS